MDNYAIAWVVIAVSALVGGLACWHVLAGMHSRMLRVIIVTAAVLFFATPAPVPNYPGIVAPAFLVLIFEAFFQIEGRPTVALLLLATSLGVGVIIAFAGCVLLERRGNHEPRQAPTDA